MIRAVIAAFLGYVVTVICVMAGIATVWYSLGNAFAFDGETTTASTGWSLLMLICGFAAAIVGGCAAAKIGGPKGRLAVRVLLGLIIVLGCLTFYAQMNATPMPLPEGVAIQDLTFMEAGQYAVSPMWYNVAIVIVGGIGVWLGGRICLPSVDRDAVEPTAGKESSPEAAGAD